MFTKMNQIKLVFSMIWLMEILKIQQEKQLHINFKEIKHLILIKIQKYDGYQRVLASMAYHFVDKKFKGIGVNNEIKQTEQLAEQLQKPLIKKFKRRKLFSSFKDNIWGADLADMQLISKFNKGFRFLLCVIDIVSKYAWVVLLKDKKGMTIVNAFQKIINYSKRKANEIWVD